LSIDTMPRELPEPPAGRISVSIATLRILVRSGPLTVVLVGVPLVVALLAPLIAPYHYDLQTLSDSLLPPAWLEGGSSAYLLGTDGLGRDVLSRIIYGIRTSLMVAGAAVLIAAIVGVVVGVLAGYFQGWLDQLLMRIADAQLAFPFILLGIAVIALTGPSIPTLIAVLSLRGWVIYAKVIRAVTLSLRERGFIEAVRSLGAGDSRIVVSHVLPNIVSPILVLSSFQLAELLVVESALSFLGLGVPPPLPSLGSMLGDGRQYLTSAWWIGTFPGLVIVLMVLGINMLGDTMRDVLDPRSPTRTV
jgi:peptide/nickel transport system permease protein